MDWNSKRTETRCYVVKYSFGNRETYVFCFSNTSCVRHVNQSAANDCGVGLELISTLHTRSLLWSFQLLTSNWSLSCGP